MQKSVDLFVIGGGSGGVRAARIAAGHGAMVMLAEEFRYGGTCVIRGCVPKKLLVYASQFHDAFGDAKGYGWNVDVKGFDWSTMIAAKDKELNRLEGIYVSNLEKAGVEIVRERAILLGPNEIQLASGTRIHAQKILLAVGARPFIDTAIHGHDLAISTNEMFNLPAFPKRVLVVGGGYIAVEFAGVLSGLGAKVTLNYRGEKVLRGFDEDLRDHLMSEYHKRGIDLVMNETPHEITKTMSGLRVSFTRGREPIECDAVLMATGRVPNTSDLGLERAGIKMGSNGEIIVDAQSQTNVPSVFAVGDVTNRVNLTPVAIREGHAFADSVFGNDPWAADHNLIPTAVFSEPEIGTIGMTEAGALATGRAIDIYKTSFRPMKHTISGRDTRMLMKLVVDGASDIVLGCHICGEAAGEMIQLIGIAIKMGATKAQLDATMAVHPTAAEEIVTMRNPTIRYQAKN